MLISKWFATGAIVTGLALSSLDAAAEAQRAPSASSACNQAKQFHSFLQQMAITDGNTDGWPYNDATEPKECRAGKDATTHKADAAHTSASPAPTGNAPGATANS